MERNTGSSDEPTRAKVESVDRAVHLLKAFTLEHPELGLTELAKVLALSKGTTHRLAQTLIGGGLVEQDPLTKQYRLGLGVLSMADIVRSGLDLATKARPFLERLRDQFGETVYLLMLRDGRGVCVERLEGTHPMRDLSSPPGTSFPLGVGAGGVAMLASLPTATAQQIIDPHASESLRERVKRARDRGHALAQGDVAEGVGAVAVALMDDNGAVVGAISVGGLLSRVLAVEDQIAAATAAACRDLRLAMGYRSE